MSTPKRIYKLTNIPPRNIISDGAEDGADFLPKQSDGEYYYQGDQTDQKGIFS